MLQNSSGAPESNILSLRRGAVGGHAMPLEEGVKFHKRWPFRVASACDAIALEDARPHVQKDDANFVT